MSGGSTPSRSRRGASGEITVGVAPAFDAEQATPEEREDLPAHLRHEVALPGLVGCHPRLGHAVGDDLVVGHRGVAAGSSAGRDRHAAHSNTNSNTVNQTYVL